MMRWNVEALSLMVSIGCASSAWAAGDVVWDPTGGVGDLTDPANWVGGVLPDATDTAVFNTPGGSTEANLSVPAFVVSDISILAGDTTFDLSGRTFATGGIGLGLGGDIAALLLQNATLSGQSLSAGDGAGSDVDLIINAGGRLTLTGALSAMSDTAVVIDGGIVTVGSLSLANAIDFQGGTLTVNGGLAWADLGSPAALTLGASHDLTATGLFSNDAGDALTLDGGRLSVGSLDLADPIDFVSGTLVVDDDLSWDDLGSPTSLTLGASHDLTATGQFTYDAGDLLTLDGGALSAHALVGTGVLDYVSGALSVGTGIDIGSGRDITSSVTLLAGDSWQSDGTISIDAGFGLTLDGGFIGGDTVGVQAGAVFTMSSGNATLETLGNDGSVVLNGGTLTIMRYNSTAGASLAINGPAFVRLTQQDLRLEPGADWGDTLTLADDSTVQADNETLIGTTGPATLTLGAGATFRTTTLVLGDQATLNLDPTASLQANTVTNEDTLAVEDYLVHGIQPWTAPIVTLNNRGTLTYNTPGTAVAPAHLVGNGNVHVMDGTLVLDRTDAGETETLTQNIMTIDAGAELVLRDDGSLHGTDSIDRLTFSTGASPSLVNSGRLTLDHITVQLFSAYTGSGEVHLTEESRFRIPGGMAMMFHDLTAESSSSFYRTDFDNGTVEVTVLRSTALSTFFSEPINVTFVEDVTVWAPGLGMEGDLTNLGILRLADDAEVVGPTLGPTYSNRLNAPGASILLGDGSRFVPQGSFQNFGTVAVVGTGTGTVGVTSLTGNGVFDAGMGKLEVFVNSNGSWSGQFLGGAGSETLININNTLLTLTSAGLIDTDGDLTLESGGATTVIAAPLHVDGLLTLSDNIVEIADASTAFEITDLAIGHDTIVRVTSAQTIDAESLTILNSGASNPGQATIETAGQFNIGAGGVLAGGQLALQGGGTFSIAGDFGDLGYLRVDGSRAEIGGTLQMARGQDISLDNGGELVVLAGGSLSGIDIDGESSGERLVNYGTITIDDGEEWRDLAIENHGTLRVIDGEGFNVRNAVSFLLTGDFTAEQNTYVQLGNVQQTAAGDLTAAGTVRLFQTNTFAGRVDLSGGDLEIFSTIVFEPGADVVSLGSVTVYGGYLDGMSGGPIKVEDFDLVESLNSHLPTPDSIYVQGRITSAANKHVSPSVIASGRVTPGRGNDNYNWLRFRRDLTLEDGASVELEVISENTFDWVEVVRTMVIEEGVTLDLITQPANSNSLQHGSSVRLVKTSAPIIGAFETVEGLAFGNGLQWHLTYDATGILAQVQFAGDVDGNGFVGATDLEVLLAQWGGETNAGTGADLTGDGLIGEDDLNLVIANWGNGALPSPNVPEPGSLAMLGLMLLAPRRRRSR